MIHFMGYEDSIIEACNKERTTIIYGTGTYANCYSHYIPNYMYACNTYVNGEVYFQGKRILSPRDLEEITGEINIIIFSHMPEVRREIKKVLSGLTIEAYVFEFNYNIDFNCFHVADKQRDRRELKKIRLILFVKGWIMEKFALRMKEQLEKRGFQVSIDSQIEEDADINHFIGFHWYEPLRDNRDTLMITHVMNKDVAEMLIKQLEVARMGICMSKEVMDKLVLWGVPREKLCYINPAHDGVIKPKKYVLGITHRNYKDHRKRQGALLDICNKLDPQYFTIKIMGRGWDEDVSELRNMGFEVEYYADFDYETYVNMIPTLDYFLFWGFDEGTMGYLDAIAAGVETLVTPQGFHLDVKDGITYPCRTVNDFVDVLLQQQEKRKKRIKAVEDWTWERYVDKHIKVWKYVLGSDGEEDFYENQHIYEDGENSVFRNIDIRD